MNYTGIVENMASVQESKAREIVDKLMKIDPSKLKELKDGLNDVSREAGDTEMFKAIAGFVSAFSAHPKFSGMFESFVIQASESFLTNPFQAKDFILSLAAQMAFLAYEVGKNEVMVDSEVSDLRRLFERSGNSPSV